MQPEIVTPLFVFDQPCCGVTAHDALADAESYHEVYDIEKGTCFGFDAVGRPLVFSVTPEDRTRITAADGPPRPEEFAARLREYFEDDERFADPTAELPQLVEWAAAKVRVIDSDHPILSFFGEMFAALGTYLYRSVRGLFRT